MGRLPTKNKNLPPRMRRRTQKSGRVFFYYDMGGQPRREIPLGQDFILAVKKWAELEGEKEVPQANQITFRYAAERYKLEVLPRKAPRTQRDNLLELENLLAFFDHPPAPLDEIKPVHIRQYLDWRVKHSQAKLIQLNEERVRRQLPPLKISGKEGQVRANREKALFSHIFNTARSLGLTNTPNPCLGIKGYSESGRDVYVEDDMFDAVWQAADWPTRDAMDLAYLTGQRPADTLQYRDSDIREGFLFVQQGKTGKKLRIEVSGKLAEVVERIAERKRSGQFKFDSPYLIINEQGKALSHHALHQRFDKARKIAGVDKASFQFRDLRAKAGTDKTDSSGNILEAQRQLGHASVTMTEAYVRNRKGDKIGPTK